ncbi:isopenicillin N synthase family dioxygenase [Streptomyces sp. NPDC056987]|uniref:isopenicillin N synthase family dioxygenase n=1 Tax=Streptomyces sp. NPDC056987 TaxID=3345988 RepID=UPI003635D20B
MPDSNPATGTDVVLVDGYVPVIGLDRAGPHDPIRRGAVVRALAKACETSGFFVVAEHGVPQETITGLHRLAREFFGWPDRAKQLVANDPVDLLQLGYCAYDGIEMFSASRLGEPGAVADDGSASPNRRPDMPGLRETCLAYYDAVGTLALEITRLLATALGLSEGWFDDKFDHHMTPLGIDYYPPLSEPAPPGALRIADHTDFGTATLLQQDDAPGGACRSWTARATGRTSPSIPGTFVVNLGRLMTTRANDRWLSTRHRVVCPPADECHRDRISIAFLLQPNADALISCIPTCADERSPARHREVASGDYFAARARRVYVQHLMRHASAPGAPE